MKLCRFAPSPTGYLHRGHLTSALWTWAGAKTMGAQVALRIEDHDGQRSRPHFIQGLIQDLETLGLEWDQGPWIQSQNKKRYSEILAELSKQELVYTCDCSRKDLAAQQRGPSGELIYPGFCQNKKLSIGGIRCKVPLDLQIPWLDHWHGWQNGCVPLEAGDFLLKDRHGFWTYQYCCAIDDLDQGIDLIIRGQDLLHSTARQLYLRALVHSSAPMPYFAHHPLLLDVQQRKLSKRDGDLPLRAELAQGRSKEELFAQVIRQMGIFVPDSKIQIDQALDLVAQVFKQRISTI